MFRFRNHSISQKLRWMNLLVSGAALLLACGAFVTYDLISFRERIIRNLSIQAEIVGSNSISALLFNDSQSAQKTLSALNASPYIVSAAIYTPDNKPFAAYWRAGEDKAGRLPEHPVATIKLSFKGGEIVVLRPVLFQGKVAGMVYIQSDLQELISRLKRYALLVGGVLLISLMAALLTSVMIGRSIAAPIVQLADTARIVSQEKIYSVRAPATGNRDELAVLINTFNEMLTQIQARDTALEEARDHLEQRVEERTAQLNAANQELEAFSYSVSHDLRAPLRHIRSFSGILQEEYGAQLDPVAQGYVQRIRTGAVHMTQLIEDLLRLSRLGRQEPARQPTDLNSLLQAVLQELQPELEGRQIEWRIAELPVVECDSGLMKQVFANLLSNAVKYTRRRELTIIEVSYSMRDGAPVFFVRDNGAGFDQRYADKLFGVFQRLHRAEEFEGTGVGLATVQRIVQKHGGQIWADSEVEKGATFSFSLGVGRDTVREKSVVAAASGEG